MKTELHASPKKEYKTIIIKDGSIKAGNASLILGKAITNWSGSWVLAPNGNVWFSIEQLEGLVEAMKEINEHDGQNLQIQK